MVTIRGGYRPWSQYGEGTGHGDNTGRVPAMVTDPASMTWSSPVAGQSCAHASSLLVCRYSTRVPLFKALQTLSSSSIPTPCTPCSPDDTRHEICRIPPGCSGVLEGVRALSPPLSVFLSLSRSLALSLSVALFLPCIYELVLAHCYPVECLNSGQLSIALSLALCVSAPTPLCLLQLVPLEADTCYS